MKPTLPFVAGALLALAVSPSPAQFNNIVSRINVTGLTGGNVECRGVCRTQTPVRGLRLWVSARALPAVAGNPHLLYEIDPTVPAVVGVHNQPTVLGPGCPFGIRDLAWDGGQYLFGVQERAVANVIHRFDIDTAAWLAPIAIASAATVGPAVLQGLAVIPPAAGGPMFFATDGTATVYPLPFVAPLTVDFGVPVASGFGSIMGAGFDSTSKRLLWLSNGAGGEDLDPARSIGAIVADGRYCVGGGVYGFMANRAYGDLSLPAVGGFMGGRAMGMDTDRLAPGGAVHGLLLQSSTADWVVELDLELNRGTTCTCGPICGVMMPSGLGMAGTTGFVPGGAGFAWEVRNANCAIGDFAFVMLDVAMGPGYPVPGGCTYLLGLPPLIVPGAGGLVGAGGTATIPFPIPAFGPGVKLDLAFQALTISPAWVATTSLAAVVQLR